MVDRGHMARWKYFPHGCHVRQAWVVAQYIRLEYTYQPFLQQISLESQVNTALYWGLVSFTISKLKSLIFKIPKLRRSKIIIPIK